MTQVIEDVLNIVPDGKGGWAVGIPTVNGVKYASGITLGTALTAMNVQITESAANVATNTAELADIKAWLIENFSYTPPPREESSSYLTPLFAEMQQVANPGAESTEGDGTDSGTEVSA